MQNWSFMRREFTSVRWIGSARGDLAILYRAIICSLESIDYVRWTFGVSFRVKVLKRRSVELAVPGLLCQ